MNENKFAALFLNRATEPVRGSLAVLFRNARRVTGDVMANRPMTDDQRRAMFAKRSGAYVAPGAKRATPTFSQAAHLERLNAGLPGQTNVATIQANLQATAAQQNINRQNAQAREAAMQQMIDGLRTLPGLNTTLPIPKGTAGLVSILPVAREPVQIVTTPEARPQTLAPIVVGRNVNGKPITAIPTWNAATNGYANMIPADNTAKLTTAPISITPTQAPVRHAVVPSASAAVVTPALPAPEPAQVVTKPETRPATGGLPLWGSALGRLQILQTARGKTAVKSALSKYAK